ncbi:hypothetical protein [Parasitella parasitica]|uniref:PHD-type domain-containing protein n=1 Tax=Parasitella parasitica TaxID=35722 RepID=A0A0B7NF71_9FUNG|nr:hypothetical protein [Parasitella parasitica]
MSKASAKVDKIHSDSDLSLQLSDASSLSSDSDLPEAKNRRNKKKPAKKTKTKPKKKKKTVKKDFHKYCICRKGYDGKEFMIECEDCKEWFHGDCVGLKPNSASYHYACTSCASKRKPVSAGKTSIPPPPLPKNKKAVIVAKSPPTPPQPIPVLTKLSTQDDEDEDLDDICVLCDGDCTCNIQNAPNLPTPPPPTPLPQQKQKSIQKLPTKITISMPKKSSKAISNKKAKKYNAWTVRNTNDDTDDDDSDICISDSQESHSDDGDAVVERIGIDTKKMKSKTPKKKTMPKKSIPPVRRGKSKTVMANVVRQKAPPSYSVKKVKGKKMAVNKYPLSDDYDEEEGEASEGEDSDEELIVDELDDLLETMSPLSEHSSNESDNSLLGSEEFFTDDDESDLDQNGSEVHAGSSPYTSSIHYDSGDDEDIENVETQKIINELTLDSDEEADDVDSDVLDEQGGMFIEDEDDDLDQENEEDMHHIYYARNNSHWSSSSEEEEEEFDYTTAVPSEEDVASIDSADDDKTNPLLPLLDSEGNIYNTIAAAFMQALMPMGDINAHGDITAGANTPIIGEDYQLSAFELTSALSALSAETSRQQSDILQRRPSLPSSAVSAARRMRGSQDFSTSEALRALSALASDDLSLALEPIDETEHKQQEEPPTSNALNEEPSTPDNFPAQLAYSLSTDPKLQEQILEILQGGGGASPRIAAETAEQNEREKLQTKSNTPPSTHNHNNTTTTSSSTAKSIYSPSRQILPKPSGSGSSLSSISASISTLEQQIQEALIQSLTNSNKRKATHGLENDKKRRSSRSNSIGSSANQHHSHQPMEASSFSMPASPIAILDEMGSMNMDSNLDGQETAVSMDDLVDTSQLYTRSSSRSPSPEIEDTYSRDLSRWQRIPIGAFRLMRSKNKLWLER